MKAYRVVVSDKAKSDIDDLFDFIVTEYKSILTANRYIDGLENAIHSLSRSAEIYRLQDNGYFKQFGDNVRRVNF